MARRVDHRAALRLPSVTHKQRAEEQRAADGRERYCPCTPRPDLDVTVAHGDNGSSADPLAADLVSSLSAAVALLVNHAVDIVERLGVAVTPAGEVALQAGRGCPGSRRS